jgi:cytochrome c peroxidase
MRTAAAIGMLALALGARAQTPFSTEERARLVAHGPWPPPAPVSANAPAIAFGERLFYEPRLSGTGSVLCASCHVPYQHFQDGRATAFGLAPVERNTPSLVNVAFYRHYGWDGGRDTLAAQSIRPLLEAREMRSSAAHVAALVRERYAADYERAFGGEIPAGDEKVLAQIGEALAAFEQTLISGRTPFDEFRDALARGDERAAARYPLAARRGALLFVGSGGCSGCHAGPHFASELKPAQGEFRVPSLRNVALTAPYMHDGSAGSLKELLRRHAPRDMTSEEQDDIAAFLGTLSDNAQLH